VQLEAADTNRFRHGSVVRVSITASSGRYAVFSDGALLGIGRIEGDLLHPETVIDAEPG
jgi:hypothetical protein